MKLIRSFAALAAAVLLPSAATLADTTNTVVTTLATVRDGANVNVDINETTLGYVMVKYATGNAAKSYYLFDLAGTLPNTNAVAKFTISKFSNSMIQHVKLWGLNQAYPGFTSAITWNTAQANELASNDLLTDPTNTYTATLITDALVPTTFTTYDFTLPGGPGGWGRFIVGDKLVLVLTGMADGANHANGLRIAATNVALLPVLTFSSTAGNQLPAITPIPDLSLYQSAVSSQLRFTVSDDLDPADQLYVFATSDTPAVIDAAPQIEFSPFPYGSNRWLKVTAGTTVGEARITVHVQGIYGLENVTSFNVTVLPDPVISVIPLGTTLKNTPSAPIPLTVHSADTLPPGLTVVGVSANPAIVPDTGFALTTAGTNRTVTITPATDATGVAPVTLWVSDGVNSNRTSFGFMVLPAADVVFCERFDYADGFLNLLSPRFWTLRTAGGTRLSVTNQQAVLRSSGASWDSVIAPFAGGPYAVGSRAVFYLRCTAEWTVLPRNSTGPFLHLYDASGGLLAKVHTVTNNVPDGFFRLGIASGPGNAYQDLAMDFTTNVTYSIVARYDPDAGASALWVNAAAETDPHVTASDVPASASLTSVGLRQQAGIGTIRLDDVQVTLATRPDISGIQVAGTAVEITFVGAAGDVPADFAVLGATDATGPYANASATITTIAPGAFRAVLPMSGNQSFYQIRRAPVAF